MITAVDTNVLLDVFIPSDEHGPRSRDWLSAAYDAGALIVCDVVYAELVPSASDRAALDRALRETGATLSPIDSSIAYEAGLRWMRYRRSGGPRATDCLRLPYRRPRGCRGRCFSHSGSRLLLDLLSGVEESGRPVTTHARPNNLRANPSFFLVCPVTHPSPSSPILIGDLLPPPRFRRSRDACPAGEFHNWSAGSAPLPLTTGFAAHWQIPIALIYTGGTTDSGVSPLAARAAFWTPNLTESIVDSMAMLARWGVMTTLSRSSNGLSGGVGSTSVTSRPAAFITPALSARVLAPPRRLPARGTCLSGSPWASSCRTHGRR